MYITIDGDDVGRKITASYIENDELKLIKISNNINDATTKISSLLYKNGFKIIFQAADGVTAKIDKDVDLYAIFNEMKSLAFDGITFSAGVGMNLREAYIALLNSKSNGKNMLSIYKNI
ncbi:MULTISPECIES: mCpol domain-containing protein [Enterobacteriaceae]|uniref:mCpol domain-containing protein n=1 Tax=Enterobacteriaceae TaxID=543 RepID=UPI001FA818A8|nr:MULTISPECIES: mCpol domain-containing protein [Enterobacteriaceae]MCI4450435.1 mCpol domain-containing protein [Klebsiella variicola]